MADSEQLIKRSLPSVNETRKLREECQSYVGRKDKELRDAVDEDKKLQRWKEAKRRWQRDDEA